MAKFAQGVLKLGKKDGKEKTSLKNRLALVRHLLS
jgi:hypothetical protein